MKICTGLPFSNIATIKTVIRQQKLIEILKKIKILSLIDAIGEWDEYKNTINKKSAL